MTKVYQENLIRQIDVFDKETEGLVDEIAIRSFNLEIFRKRFNAKPDDPLMYNPYEITDATVDLFPNLAFDFNKYYYSLGCYQAE